MFMKVVEKLNNKWVRLLILIIVLINSIGWIMGVQLIPYTDEQIAKGISSAALIASEIWNHWKNNSYTNEAKRADAYLKSCKEQKKRDYLAEVSK